MVEPQCGRTRIVRQTVRNTLRLTPDAPEEYEETTLLRCVREPGHGGEHYAVPVYADAMAVIFTDEPAALSVLDEAVNGDGGESDSDRGEAHAAIDGCTYCLPRAVPAERPERHPSPSAIHGGGPCDCDALDAAAER